MSRVLYRIAAVLIVLLGLGHTIGYPWSDPAWGVDLHAIQAPHFNVLGSSRSYWDFYVGFGLSVSVLLLLPAIAAWQLSNSLPLGGDHPLPGRGPCLFSIFENVARLTFESAADRVQRR